MTARLARSFEAAVAGTAWAALVVGLAVAVLTVPVYTSAAVQALGIPASAGLSTADALELSGAARALVVDPLYDPLPAQWKGMPAFDEASVSHLLDVRAVMHGARIATGAVAALLAAWVGLGVARRRWAALRAGMRTGAWIVLAVMVLAVLAATVDFSAFFSAFHGLFFASGTWLFPYDSMLIRLFPERFWVTSGAAWGTLAGTGAGLLLLASRFVPSVPPSGPSTDALVALREEEGSRSADNV